MEWEKIFPNHISDKELILKINKELSELNSKNKNNSNFKMDRGTKQTIFQRRNINGQQVHEKLLTSLIIREMQIKTTMRYRFTSTRIAIIKKLGNDKCWQGHGETKKLQVGM